MLARTVLDIMEMAAASTKFLLMIALPIIGPAIIIFVIIATKYWYFAILYLLWIWVLDKHTPETGGRTWNWFRGLKLFEYAKNYYPVTLSAVPEFNLDSKTNYMFCCFPHGIMPMGLVIALTTKSCGIDELIPHHKLHPLTLQFNFKIPLYREYVSFLSGCSVSLKSLNYLLSYPDGGKIACWTIGGAAEALFSSPGVYKIVLKNRKGFVKVALKNGSPIVPVFSFGEIDTFEQVQNFLLKRFQEWCKKKTGFFPPFYVGRAYGVGVVPRKVPINVVVGKPIEVKKTANPSAQEIDALHQTFMTSITELFEKYKYKYIENPETTKLTIV